MKNDEIVSLASQLRWGDRVLYYKRNYDIFGVPEQDVVCSLVDNEVKKSSNHIFYVNFLNQTECTISHTFGDLIYYLVSSENGIKMSCKVNDDNHKFICSIDETENGYKL